MLNKYYSIIISREGFHTTTNNVRRNQLLRAPVSSLPRRCVVVFCSEIQRGALLFCALFTLIVLALPCLSSGRGWLLCTRCAGLRGCTVRSRLTLLCTRCSRRGRACSRQVKFVCVWVWFCTTHWFSGSKVSSDVVVKVRSSSYSRRSNDFTHEQHARGTTEYVRLLYDSKEQRQQSEYPRCSAELRSLLHTTIS